MLKSFSIVIFFTITSLGLAGQSRGFASYSVSDGLAQSNVIDIAEDNLGNLWLATEGGLCKFNGIQFTTYKKQDGLSSNNLRCVTVAGNKVWMGTDQGISSFDGQEFENFPLPGLPQKQWVSKIHTDHNGNVWYATSAGAAAIIPREGQNPPSNSFEVGRVSGFADAGDALWISTYKDGIYRYQEGNLEKIALTSELEEAMITAIYSNEQQEIWLGTNGGLYHWSSGTFRFVHSFHMPSGKFYINSINEEAGGAIWVGTTRGAYEFRNGECSAVNASHGLTDNIVYKIHRDREGTLWFGSFGGGMYKSLGELFTHIDKKQGLSYDYISYITRDIHKDYWFGSYGGGVYKVTFPESPEASVEVVNINHKQGLSSDFIYCLVPEVNDELWIGTTHGLNKLSNGVLTTYYQEDGLPSNQVFSMVKCKDGTLYCGTAAGLTRIEAQGAVKFTNFQYQGDTDHNKIRTILETAEGQLILATMGGLKKFDGETITDYFRSDSLKHLPVSTMYEDEQGGLWCALADDGVLYHNPKSQQVYHLTESQGLSSNIVYSLVVDRYGCLWVGTPHGLDKVSFGEDGTIQQIRHFGAHEGFFGIETNTNALFQEEDGSIWFGTVAGAFKCSPHLDKVNNLEPITSITSVRLFSEPLARSGLEKSGKDWYHLPENLTLPHHQNHLTFEFFGNSLKNPSQVNYQYKLENFDRDWQLVTSKNEAVYTNLPPGQYMFQVKASNNDGVWNRQAASISFEITPPFWRTWWFFTLAVLAVGIAGRLYYKSRVQTKLDALLQVEKIKHQETIKVRRRVAEDFHDQVGNQLASITVLVQLIQAKLSSGNQEVEEMLQKLGQFTKGLFTGTRDFIWSIDPKSDRVNEMLIYIRDYGEELFEYTDVNFHVETNDTFNAITELPIGWSRHIVYIFKEALANSHKHAGCKNVYLNFNVTDHNYLFELRDDGKGLNGYQEGDLLGMGLKNMKDRARKIGGDILISSHQDAGTKIILEGKIPQNEG